MIRHIMLTAAAIMAAVLATAPTANAGPYVHYQNSVDQFAAEQGLPAASWFNVDSNTIVSTLCGSIPSRQALAYCHYDDTAYIGDDAGEQIAQFHPLAPGIVIAHEWGHALQDAAGVIAPVQAAEDGADCVAGAWLNWANQKGHIRVGLLDLPGLYDLLNFAKKQSEHDIHGTLIDRGVAMVNGFTRGLDYCGTQYMAIRK